MKLINLLNEESNYRNNTGMYNILNSFFQYLKERYIREKISIIYNEDSLKFELGSFFKNKKYFEDSDNYKVEFERNIYYFGIKKTTEKKEIDICIIDLKNNDKYAIELKYTTKLNSTGSNTGITKKYKEFIEDLKFMNYVKENGFKKTYAINVTKDNYCYDNNSKSDDSKYFKLKDIENFKKYIVIDAYKKKLELIQYKEIKYNDFFEFINNNKIKETNEHNSKYYIVEFNDIL